MIVRPAGPADTLHVQIEGRVDDAVDMISASTGVPLEAHQVAAGNERAARDGVAACPELALRLTE